MAENGRRKGDGELLVALASGQTVRDAARSAGIGERTATRRAADPAFRRRVADLRAAMVSQAMGRLADASTAAVDALRGLLSSESDSAKLGAARAILEIGNRLREAVETEARIAALEARLLGTPTAIRERA